MDVKQSYSWQDVDYYLKSFDEIKEEVDNFLVTSQNKKSGEKLNIIESKVGNKSEEELVKKLDDPWYKKRKYALNCVKKLYKEMDDSTFDIMRLRFKEKEKLKDIAIKVHYEYRTVHRKISKQRVKLYNLLNNVT